MRWKRVCLLLPACFLWLGGCSARRVDITLTRDWSGDDVCLRMHRAQGWHSEAEIEDKWLNDTQRTHLRDVASRAAPSIVQIRTARRSMEPLCKNAAGVAIETGRLFGGTGVIIDHRGVILTNEHVVRDADSIEVILSDGSIAVVERVLLAPRRDLAVLRIRAAGRLKPLEMDMTLCECGAGVVAVANLGGDEGDAFLFGVVTRPVVSLQSQLDPARHRSYENLVESTAQLEPGFSGGPLLDVAGNLVGINVAASGPDHLGDIWGYSVPLDRQTRAVVRDLVRQLLMSTPADSRKWDSGLACIFAGGALP